MHVQPDTGARYRIRSQGGAFLRKRSTAIGVSSHFFTLFDVRPLSQSPQHVLQAHGAAGWVARGGAREALVEVGTKNATAMQRFWLRALHGGGWSLDLDAEGTSYLCAAGASGQQERPVVPRLVIVGVAGTAPAAPGAVPTACAPPSGARGRRPAAATFELQRVVAPYSERPPAANTSAAGDGNFAEAVRASVEVHAGRRVVLATYYNLGMLDWAEIFWGWLVVSGYRHLLLLDLDGLTCDASRALLSAHGPPLSRLNLACARAVDMALGKLRDAGSVQAWGTHAASNYLKFLRMKLRLVERVLALDVDCVIADVDVLVMRSDFVGAMVRAGRDLAISSDARRGSYDDNEHCPCSNEMYQRFASDWVCAGLFYARATAGAGWFLRQVQQLMDAYTITDQDAIQALLTGHTQVAVPQVPMRHRAPPAAKGRFAEGEASPLSPGFRPSGNWLKPMWLEAIPASGNLRDLRGIQALNTPMRPALWSKMRAKQRAHGFTWETLPLERFANGPILVDGWETTYRKRTPRRPAEQLSIHANCYSKYWLENDRRGASFLLHPLRAYNASD